jgi:hypothetical protein
VAVAAYGAETGYIIVAINETLHHKIICQGRELTCTVSTFVSTISISSSLVLAEEEEEREEEEDH